MKSPADILYGNEKRVLARMFGDDAACDAGMEDAGDWIGPYRLIERLGEGGFGVVWRAEQTDPVTREVALKIIKRGMDTRQVLARFNQERQALAGMDHPGIAAMHDAGASTDGRPYFAMELVRGEPVTQWCEKRQSPVHERLRLFQQVCGAVHHAHQKGIIHRDLKPSNILITEVDGIASPKIIDFGIAKAIHQSALDDLSLVTRADQVVGTPLYMSPEQIAGREIDTRSDIYALGVLLYELLNGTPPFDADALAREGLDGMKRHIREHPPSRPSTLIRERKRREGEKPALPPPSVHGAPDFSSDLDWITLRALEKDRSRRYQSATELAADIHRFLHHEPVLARPPSFGYITGRWIKRHLAAFIAACLVLVSMIAGTGLALWQAGVARAAQLVAESREVLARQAGQRAEQARKQSEQTAAFVTGLLDRVIEEAGKGRNPEALKAALAHSGDDIEKLHAAPDLRIDLLERVAEIYSSIGETKLALPVRRQLMGEVVALHGADSVKGQEAQFDYIKVVIDHGDRATGPPMLEDLLRRVEAQGRRGDKFWFEVQRRLVSAWVKLRSAAPALAAAEVGMAEARAQKLTGRAMMSNQLSYVAALDLAGRFEQAETLLDELRAEALKENYTKQLEDIDKALLHLFWRSDNNARAAALLREQLPAQQARLGKDTKEIVPKLLELSTYEAHARENSSAMEHAQQALTIMRQLASAKAGADGKGDISSLRRDLFASLNALASAEDNAHLYTESIAHRTEALAVARQEGNNDHIDIALDGLGFSHRKTGMLDESYAFYEQMQQHQRETNANFKDILEGYSNLIAIRTDQGRHADAVALARQMWALLVKETSAKEDQDYFGHVANQAWNAFKAWRQTTPDAPEPVELTDWQNAAAQADLGSTRVRN